MTDPAGRGDLSQSRTKGALGHSHRQHRRESISELQKSMKMDPVHEPGLEAVLKNQREKQRTTHDISVPREEEKLESKHKHKSKHKDRPADPKETKGKGKERKGEAGAKREPSEEIPVSETVVKEADPEKEKTEKKSRRSSRAKNPDTSTSPQSADSSTLEADFVNAIRRHAELKKEAHKFDYSPTMVQAESDVPAKRPDSPEFEEALRSYKRSLDFLGREENSQSLNLSASGRARSVYANPSNPSDAKLSRRNTITCAPKPHHLAPMSQHLDGECEQAEPSPEVCAPYLPVPEETTDTVSPSKFKGLLELHNQHLHGSTDMPALANDGDTISPGKRGLLEHHRSREEPNAHPPKSQHHPKRSSKPTSETKDSA
eukprot:NODE_2089_length_1283_cov_15.190311_g1988_i0.p1 GENE.NODE_2089_length_1283_cov_15.190311_g1988_i0~~NODE_2089_length_1283_cov_15.190311_g1988_i0.p1  ORF type:complete len:374 (-),score=76.93 NODE_2089_length_1283_cov_15.190311_g1988_i0:90-1211(-)